MKLRKMWGDPKVNGGNFDPDVFYHKRRDVIAETPFYILTEKKLKELARYFWGEGYRFCGFIPEDESTEFEEDFINFMEAQYD